MTAYEIVIPDPRTRAAAIALAHKLGREWGLLDLTVGQLKELAEAALAAAAQASREAKP